ncbi:MAG: sulfite exporter TauE/SafE family protein [Bacteroidota bacterium]
MTGLESEVAGLIPATIVGLIGGTLVGLTGVGAGSVIAAGLLVAFPQVAPKVIVGTATVQAVVMKLFGVLARRRFRFREGPLGLAMALGAIPLAAAGAWASSLIGGDVLRPLMALVLLGVGLALVAQAVPRAPDSTETYRELSGQGDRDRDRYGPAPDPTGAAEWDVSAREEAVREVAHAADPRRAHVGALGALVGFIAGLTSIGTGTLFVSALVGPLKMDAHRAVAVALLAGLLTLVVSGATHAFLGHVDPALAGGVLLGSVPGVLLGTFASRRLSVGALRGTIGAGIAVAAVVALARLGR